MSANRYIYRERKLTHDEAYHLRANEIDCLVERRVSLTAELEEIEEALGELLRSPLPTSICEQITLRPGDEGYEEAPTNLDPTNYQGDITWRTAEPQLGDTECE